MYSRGLLRVGGMLILMNVHNALAPFQNRQLRLHSVKCGNYSELAPIRYIDPDCVILFILLLNELLVDRLQYAPATVATLCVYCLWSVTSVLYLYTHAMFCFNKSVILFSVTKFLSDVI